MEGDVRCLEVVDPKCKLVHYIVQLASPDIHAFLMLPMLSTNNFPQLTKFCPIIITSLFQWFNNALMHIAHKTTITFTFFTLILFRAVISDFSYYYYYYYYFLIILYFFFTFSFLLCN